ncbi:MAG TPA: universal stress protein [Steroidobacteraceae bacterium]|nr:universal stress protein [Steroidobacteraceae bacterium]
MPDTASDPGAPRKILLATDLSARGDRALERAIAISRRHSAQLIIVHAFEEFDEATLHYGRRGEPSWRRPPDAAAQMKRRVRQGLHAQLGDAVDNATIVIEEGDPADIVERLAASELVDLVVAGIARESPFASRPVILGKTVEQLLRRLPVPILVVRNRVAGEYGHVVVTTDFSDSSGRALQVALRFFPSQTVYLLHASEAPYSTLAPDAGRHAERFQEARSDDLAAFLASVYLSEADRKRLVPLIEPGPPPQLIREYVQTQGADLVVLGTRGRGAVLEALLGSTAKSILATLPCDALVVRGPRP